MLTTDRPLRLAVLCSRRAPGLAYLLRDDVRRGRLYEVVCVVTSESACRDLASIQALGVPVMVHPILEFYRQRGATLQGTPEVRAEYDRHTAELLAPFAPDLILLDGYLYLVSSPFLDTYGGRVLNLHFSDLTIRAEDGAPAFPGRHAVRDALTAGAHDTRATVHLVDEVPDGGPPIVRSWSFPVSPLVASARAWGAIDMLHVYAHAHQEWMIGSASGPLLSAAVALVADRGFSLERCLGSAPGSTIPWDLDERGVICHPVAGIRLLRRVYGRPA